MNSWGLPVLIVGIMPVPIKEVQLFEWALANTIVNNNGSGLTASTEDTFFGQGIDPLTSDQQRARDKFDMDDENWNEAVFEEVNGSSVAKLALHNDWVHEKGYQIDAIVNLNLPEQGISGAFKVTSIKHILPQKKPVDEDPSDDFEYRPVTGIFVHTSNDVWKIRFDNNDSLGVTANHPIYSTTYQDWRFAGELEAGEKVLAFENETVVTSKEKQGGEYEVFNLEVRGLHNFLVGRDGVVVHNSCWGIWLKKLLGKSIDDIQDITGKTWAKKLDNSLKQKEIDAMESLGGELQEDIVGLTESFPGIDAISKEGKIITLKHSTGTMSAVEKLLKEMTDKVDLHDQGYFDVIGVMTAKGHPTSTIISKIDDILDKNPSRFSKFEKVLIEGSDGKAWYNF